MVDTTVLFSTISGLGGAVLGAIGGVYGPVLLERRRDSTQQSGDAHVTVAKARQAGHAWLRLVHRVVQDLQAGKTVDIVAFDEATESAMETVTAAVTDLARPGVELRRVPAATTDGSGSAMTRMWETVRQLREIILGLSDTSGLADIEAEARYAREELGYLLQSEIETRIGHPLPAPVSQAYPQPFVPTTQPTSPPPHLDPRNSGWPGDGSGPNGP
ncbi:hypothetical protein ACFV3E_43165 [Streptomyces sp. NPDC059718]